MGRPTSRATPPTRRASRRRPPGARTRMPIVVERLRAEYPDPECALTHDSPFQLLVATILSAQSTDQTVNLVTPALFERYPGPAEMAGARRAALEELIHATGFFRSKARAIQEMSQDLVSRYAGEVPSRMEDLVTLHGVGRKTANVVLGVAFGQPGFAVDTHVTRLTRLLRLTTTRDPVGIEEDVCSMVPPQEWAALGLRLILHGRRVCIARRPRCADCVLNDICPSAQLPAAREGPGLPKLRSQGSARPMRSDGHTARHHRGYRQYMPPSGRSSRGCLAIAMCPASDAR